MVLVGGCGALPLSSVDAFHYWKLGGEPWQSNWRDPSKRLARQHSGGLGGKPNNHNPQLRSIEYDLLWQIVGIYWIWSGLTTFTGSHVFFCALVSLVHLPGRLERFSAACQRHQVWLVVDNTYEHFTYEEVGSSSEDILFRTIKTTSSLCRKGTLPTVASVVTTWWTFSPSAKPSAWWAGE